MSTKIIISSGEIVVCPRCKNEFHLHQGITQHTMEKYETEFEKEFKKKEEELREGLEKEIKRKTSKEFAAKQTELEEKLSEKEEALKHKESLVKKAQKEAQEKAKEEFELERKTIQEDLAQKEKTLKEFKEREMALLKEKQKLLEAKENLELENQRKLDEERKKIQEEAAKKEAERSRFREAELTKKLEDFKQANDELQRKLEQGSQQLQGEVLELELEHLLRASFPYDHIEPVRKGARGADILQRVHTPAGQLCGTIIWEAKRAEAWSDKWLQKLKDDQMEANANIAILVTTTMSKDFHEPFRMIGDIWVTSECIVRPVAETLRNMLIEYHKLKMTNTGKNEKMELLYDYLCSQQFSQKIRAVAETFVAMKKSLDQEKAAMNKLWKQREMQIERLTVNITGMCGELQAITHGSLHQLDDIEQLSLPGGEA